jgi:hypothetical protein
MYDDFKKSDTASAGAPSSATTVLEPGATAHSGLPNADGRRGVERWTGGH